MKTVKCFDIQWDLEKDQRGALVGLPEVVRVDVPEEILEDDEGLEEYLSDSVSKLTGFCHNGLKL
jgi:hypothetical protein